MQMQGGHGRPASAYSTLAMFLLMFVGLLIFFFRNILKYMLFFSVFYYICSGNMKLFEFVLPFLLEI